MAKKGMLRGRAELLQLHPPPVGIDGYEVAIDALEDRQAGGMAIGDCLADRFAEDFEHRRHASIIPPSRPRRKSGGVALESGRRIGQTPPPRAERLRTGTCR
jgi:hypothetical protein